VYATVVTPGEIAVGDEVRILESYSRGQSPGAGRMT
jgi:hypothetical protein